MEWFHLAIAIVAEVIATSALKATDNFTRLWPSLLVVAGYATAFYFLTLTLKALPIGIVYAIWSGVGIVLVTLFAWIYYKQSLDMPAIAGITLIVAGVIIMNVFSNSVSH